MDLVYLAGAPATGKSTLMAELTRGARRVSCTDIKLVPYDELWRGEELVGAEIGKRRASFPGTDSLAMNAMSRVSEWVSKQLLDVICAEGDRLTHIKFLDAAAQAGYRVNLFLMNGRMSVLDARCEARGSTQNRNWRMGRATMCMRVAAYAEEAGYQVRHLDAEKPVSELAAIIREQVPVMENLAERAVKTETRGTHAGC